MVRMPTHWILAALFSLLLLTMAWFDASAQHAATPAGSGLYKAVMEADDTLPTHTVYRPAALDKLGRTKLPIVAFGNGSCRNDGSAYANLLTEVASHGFLVVAIGPIGGSATPVPRGARASLPAQLIDAIDWAVAENGRPASKYHGRLDTKAVAVMGHSCGSMQALEVASDPRIKTAVILNGGVFSDLSQRPGWTITKDTLAHLHETMLYLDGGPNDIAYDTAEEDFKLIASVPLFKGEMDVGHMATYDQPNAGRFGEVVDAWLKWQLKSDAGARRMFAGENCGLCGDKDWKVARKNIR